MGRRLLGCTALGIAVAITLIGTACTGGSHPKPTGTRAGTTAAYGETLRVGVMSTGPTDYDPQVELEAPVQEELARCCLFRTLLSYTGHPTRDGGAILRPMWQRPFQTSPQTG